MKRLIQALLLPLVLCTALTSCSGSDDEPLGSYRRDIVTISTDETGLITTLTQDNGTAYELTNKLQGYIASQSYRVLAYYLPTPDGEATLGRFSEVLTFPPRAYSELTIRTDPVEVVSLWRSSHYINMHLSLMASTGRHIYGGIEQGLTTHPDGTKSLRVVLFHDSNDDPKNYPRTLYLSCDISGYSTALTPGRDTITLAIREQTDSIFTDYKFVY